MQRGAGENIIQLKAGRIFFPVGIEKATYKDLWHKVYAALFRFAFSTKSPKYSANLSNPVDFLLASKVHWSVN